MHNTHLRQHDVLRQHAVDIAAQRALLLHRRGRAIQPVLHKNAGHLVAHLDRSDAFADRFDHAGTVRTGNAGQLQFRVIRASDH